MDPHEGTRFVTFNICGIKNVLNFHPWNVVRTFGNMFDYLAADIICFQETKIQAADLTKEMVMVPGFHSYFTMPASRKGYSGVAFYVKENIAVLKAEEGLTGWLPSNKLKIPYRDIPDGIGGSCDIERTQGLEIDSEGRTILLDIGDCVVIGLYCPANSQGDRPEYRDLFFELLDERVRNLISLGRKVVVLGDLNVARELGDSAERSREFWDSAEKASKETGKPVVELVDDIKYITKPSQIVNSWIEDSMGLSDTTRVKHPNRKEMYTCWNQKINARPANYGSRIDYILASKSIECFGADILPKLMGSDHCPVYADLALDLKSGASSKVPLLSTRNTCRFIGDIRNHFMVQKFSNPGKTERIIEKKKSTSLETIKTSDPLIPSETKTSDTLTPLETKTSDPGTPYIPIKSGGVTKIPLKSGWGKIFERKIPKCYHSEDCKMLVTKKSGVNKGRSYWACQRPQGDPKNKELKCNFFKWA